MSGCVLAARLTEDPNISVVLIELGSDHKDHPLVPIPGIGFKIWEDLSVTSWFKTTPQVCLFSSAYLQPPFALTVAE